MDKLSFNKLTMLRALLSFMLKNQAKWQDIAPISQVYYLIYNLVGEIDSILQAIDNPNAGELEQKQDLKETLIEDGFEIVSYIFAYADAKNNAVLRGKVDFPVSDLRNLRDGELPTRLKSILEQVVGRETEIEPYGVTAEKVERVRNLISQYEQQLPKTRNNVSDKKSGNAKIKVAMKTATDTIKNQLNKLMLRFKKEDPSFYVAYTTNRKVVDYGKRYEKPAEPEAKPADTGK
jgi:hypothetical protein